MASGGGFNLRFYESDTGEVHIGRFGEETDTLNFGGTAQVQPAGPATSPFWVKVTRAKTEYGIKPRFVQLCFETGAPNGLENGETYNVPVYSTAEFGAMTLLAPITYQGAVGTVVGKLEEDIYPGI